MTERKFKIGDMVRIVSKTSAWQGAIGEVVGYCNGHRFDVIRVKISKRHIINLLEKSVEIISYIENYTT